MFKLPSTSWSSFIKVEQNKEYFANICKFIEESNKKICPDKKDVFRCFNFFDYSDLKVVIFGQDPYHTPGVADGLAFSAKNANKVPPSLRNIFKVINNKTAFKNDLSHWASQGVLLLNSSLTVFENLPNSHSKIGWSIFVDNLIEFININCKKVVFILLGKEAQKFSCKISNEDNHILITSHPSPLGARRGFLDSDIFNRANSFLKDKIDW